MAATVKTVNGLALASMKTWNGLAAASVKTINGQDAQSGGGGNGLLTNLVSYWKLDETAGSTGIDQTGSYNLTVDGGAGVGTATGIINGGRTSNGAGSNGFLYNSTPTGLLSSTTAFFCNFWVKPAALSQSTYPGLIGVYKQTTNYAWGVYMHGTSNAVVFGLSANGTTETAVTGMTLPNTTTFHMITVGWDGSTMKIASDGGAFTTAAFAGPIFASNGKFEILSRDGAGNTFNGLIDEAGYWGRDGTSTDVTNLWNGGAGLPYSSFS